MCFKHHNPFSPVPGCEVDDGMTDDIRENVRWLRLRLGFVSVSHIACDGFPLPSFDVHRQRFCACSQHHRHGRGKFTLVVASIAQRIIVDLARCACKHMMKTTSSKTRGGMARGQVLSFKSS